MRGSTGGEVVATRISPRGFRRTSLSLHLRVSPSLSTSHLTTHLTPCLSFTSSRIQHSYRVVVHALQRLFPLCNFQLLTFPCSQSRSAYIIVALLPDLFLLLYPTHIVASYLYLHIHLYLYCYHSHLHFTSFPFPALPSQQGVPLGTPTTKHRCRRTYTFPSLPSTSKIMYY